MTRPGMDPGSVGANAGAAEATDATSRLACVKDDHSGRPCSNIPVTGDDRCWSHFGTPNGLKARRRVKAVGSFVHMGPVEEAMARGDTRTGIAYDVSRLGAPRDVDPGVALLEEVHRSAGHVRFLEEKVRAMDEAELVWGKVMEATEEKSGGGPTGDYTLTRTENRAIINVWWELYEKERKHLAQVSVACLRAGVEERRVRIAERGIDALEAAMIGALNELGLDPYDAATRAILGRHLSEAVEGGVFAPEMQAEREPLKRPAQKLSELPPVEGVIEGVISGYATEPEQAAF